MAIADDFRSIRAAIPGPLPMEYPEPARSAPPPGAMVTDLHVAREPEVPIVDVFVGHFVTDVRSGSDLHFRVPTPEFMHHAARLHPPNALWQEGRSAACAEAAVEIARSIRRGAIPPFVKVVRHDR